MGRKQGRPVCLAVGVLLATLLVAGCMPMKRRMLIRSQPEGALVTVDRQPVGHTPVAVPFTYYGTREIQVEKDGFQSQKVKHRFQAPWYQIPPLDFLTDNFSTREIDDHRVVDFQLLPLQNVDSNLLLDRANQLRGNVQRGTVAMPMAEHRGEEPTVVSEPDQTALLPPDWKPR